MIICVKYLEGYLNILEVVPVLKINTRFVSYETIIGFYRKVDRQ